MKTQQNILLKKRKSEKGCRMKVYKLKNIVFTELDFRLCDKCTYLPTKYLCSQLKTAGIRIGEAR